MQDQLEERRKKADKMYKELVKRGKKVEKEAKGRIDDIDLPKIELNSLTDRKKLEKQLDKAKARFEELKQTVGFKTAA
jgi:polyhydroxyalkanoate synthesis regulator phasin